jgi:hypothetical protein
LGRAILGCVRGRRRPYASDDPLPLGPPSEQTATTERRENHCSQTEAEVVAWQGSLTCRLPVIPGRHSGLGVAFTRWKEIPLAPVLMSRARPTGPAASARRPSPRDMANPAHSQS